MDELRKLWVVLIVAAPFWSIGLWLQRLANADHAPGYSIEAKGWWAWLLGIRPGKGERIYLGAAFYQVWALLYLITGFLIVWIGNMKTLGSITAIFIFAGSLLMLIVHLIIRFRSRRQ